MRDIWTMPLCQGKERLRDEDGKKALHSTQKPEELLKRIILGFSNENDVILDPFAGSGTTPYIAKQYNRNFIAIEKEEKYFLAINNRLNIKNYKDIKKSINISSYEVKPRYTQNCFVFNPRIEYAKYGTVK